MCVCVILQALPDVGMSLERADDKEKVPSVKLNLHPYESLFENYSYLKDYKLKKKKKTKFILISLNTILQTNSFLFFSCFSFFFILYYYFFKCNDAFSWIMDPEKSSLHRYQQRLFNYIFLIVSAANAYN